jgi:hypothetical protein
VTAQHPTSGASEFPNDNPALHRGARWVCLVPRGPARAVLRPLAAAEASAREAVAEAAAPPAVAPGGPPENAPEPRFDGPLELDLGRIVLPHRVENVPPPPDFIFRPLASARPRPPAAPAPSSSAVSVLPIDPRPCRVVDEREAGRRVDRGFRVDVAPCIEVGVAAGEPSRRQPRRRGSLAARALLSSPVGVPLPELEAASA